LSPKERADAIRPLVDGVFARTAEALDDPRARALRLARMLPQEASETDPSAIAIATEMLRVCATSPATDAGACLAEADREPLRAAARLMRRARVASLAHDAPRLGDADLADAALRVELVLALIDLGNRRDADALASRRRGAWNGAGEEALASAALAASDHSCDFAMKRLEATTSLAAAWRTDVEKVRDQCLAAKSR
jgi:hypothetical protein